jgi:hypothetical protein
VISEDLKSDKLKDSDGIVDGFSTKPPDRVQRRECIFGRLQIGCENLDQESVFLNQIESRRGKNVSVAGAEAPSPVRSRKPVGSMFVIVITHKKKTKGRFRS